MRKNIPFRSSFSYFREEMPVGETVKLNLRDKTYRIKRGKDKSGNKVFAVAGGTLETPRKGDELQVIKIINGDSYEK